MRDVGFMVMPSPLKGWLGIHWVIDDGARKGQLAAEEGDEEISILQADTGGSGVFEDIRRHWDGSVAEVDEPMTTSISVRLCVSQL
jgi:hypothetical protein